jgi:hypothetical protein
MQTYERLDKYNAIWLLLPAYYNLTPRITSCEDVSQCNVTEMKEMRRYLLGVVMQSVPGRNPAECHIFNRAIECTRGLLEFYIYARYKSHNDVSFSYLEDALHRFYTFQDVFLLGRGGKWRWPKPMP